MIFNKNVQKMFKFLFKKCQKMSFLVYIKHAKKPLHKGLKQRKTLGFP